MSQNLYSQVFYKEKEDEIEEELQEDISDLKVSKKNYLSRNFDPSEIEERYATEADKEMRLTDQPERLQLRFKK